MTSQRECQTVESNGSCSAYYPGGIDYTYDANGNMTSQRLCQTVAQDGSCSAYFPDGTEYTYDANGNMTSESRKDCFDDDCTEGIAYIYNYVYDENGNQIYSKTTSGWFSDGWEDFRDYTTCYYPDGTEYSC